MNIYQKIAVVILLGIFSVSLNGFAQTGTMADHLLVLPANIKWGAGPAHFPAGMQVAVIEGDPSSNGPYVIRAKFPKKYKIMPHFHPTDEHITVLEGTFSVGMGDKFDEAKLTKLPVGGYADMKTGNHHFAYSKKGCVIQVHGVGPFAITYVNPADDPRNKK